jgi:hypothetical protein
MFVSLSRHCFAVIPVSIFRGDSPLVRHSLMVR